MKKIQTGGRIRGYFFVLFLAVSMMFTSVNIKPAEAVFFFDGVDFTSDILKWVQGMYTQYSSEFTKVIKGKEWYKDVYETKMLPILKKMAIQKVNDMTTMVVTGGNNGKPFLVTDWNQYLIKGPADEAMVYVNSLLNNSLRGRGSAANYSNSGNYAYLQKQVTNTLNPPALNISLSSSGDWRAGMFREGNMKAFNEFLGTGNNPYSLSIIASDALAKKTSENQLIAKEEQTNGYIPKKDAFGKIMTPAAVFENSYNSASNMGREMVVNATKTDELLGAVVNLIVQSAMKPLKEGLVSASSSDGVTQLTAGINTANTGLDSANNLNNSFGQSEAGT
ncbi:MAG TPA: hypothetical protein DCX32_04290 [Candidatus Moranbacteria bacterium]|nr:MAG: hypothetical protein UW87_C0049G0005 [Candidatus Moranbacteria bacterium GW2011_GWC2_45_10]KKT93308.1 MAG: hypothetical protein UW95_C0024G0021 [Parcubacteria group bacterium GW2011_GWC1_45_14]HAV11727.1 hypothetical protein [Candidatus Moranbacteria bacterium]